MKCPSKSPTGHPCSMEEGHFGPHVVGNPEHPEQRWVTPCDGSTGKQHDYHLNRDHQGTDWEECIYCGHRRNESDPAKAFQDLLIDCLGYGNLPGSKIVRTFRDGGVLTKNYGLVVEMRDGSAFQLTIAQSKLRTP